MIEPIDDRQKSERGPRPRVTAGDAPELAAASADRAAAITAVRALWLKQTAVLERIRSAGGTAFMACNCSDVLRELN